ncbi:MAG: cation-translocating P-type ATPase [Halanaerobiales bacterium]
MDELLKKFNSNPEDGLSNEEVKRRQDKYGKNKLKESKGISPWKVFYNQIKDLMVVILFITAVAAFIIGDNIEGLAILGIIIFNSILGFVTEYKAEKSMESLKEILTPTAKVNRSSKVQEIDAGELVPGDIILLEEGDRISADGRLLESSNLSINESVLTGESETVSKDSGFQAEKEISLAERKNMVYMGTMVSRGSATVLVTKTGPDTEMGQIGTLLEDTDKKKTPLEERLDDMGKKLIKVTLVITVLITIFGILVGNPFIDTVKTGIALAIAAIPEGLPIIATVTLAIGMNKMVENNALIRRLAAVETLGSTTAICTDKTGTITENQMTLKEIYFFDKKIKISGSGYKPEGEFFIVEDKEGQEEKEGKENPDKDTKIDLEEDQQLALFLKAGTFCSNAILDKNEDGLWNVIGEPTEGALVTAARKADFNKREMEKEGAKRLAEIPFSSERMYMAVSYHIPEDGNYIFLKGSPSVVIDFCDTIYIDNNIEKLNKSRVEKLEDKNREMAGNGLRVLAVAYASEAKIKSSDRSASSGAEGAGMSINEDNDTIDSEESINKKETSTDSHESNENSNEFKISSEEEIEKIIESGLTFLGLAGIVDPPREEVKHAIEEAQSAGIRTKLITGDQTDTALSIAEKVGIIDNECDAITGQEISNMSSDEHNESINETSVFTRVSPENKLQIIEVLNKSDEVTAMTGDGVNDAPALKKADIGVSMGQRGTSVARNASDMVLLDDSFGTIVKAIKEGRVIFDNIQKFIYFLFVNNLSKIIYIFLGIVLQLPLPLLALQILWINLVIDVFPALSLAWEEPEPDVMQRSPRDPDKSILNSEFNIELFVHSTIMAVGSLIVYILSLNANFPLQLSRTISFTVISFGQLFHVFNARKKMGTGFESSVFKNRYLWIALILSAILQVLTVYNPLLQKILSTTAIPLYLWPVISMGFVIPIAVIQLIKIRKKKSF